MVTKENNMDELRDIDNLLDPLMIHIRQVSDTPNGVMKCLREQTREDIAALIRRRELEARIETHKEYVPDIHALRRIDELQSQLKGEDNSQLLGGE